MTAFGESDALHERVRAFARAKTAGEAPPESFDALAVEIARYQARSVPAFQRLVEARGGILSSADSIPAVPVDVFRLARIAAHPPELDVARFETSGTTGAASGIHPMRTTETYRDLAIAMGRKALVSAWAGPRVVVALAPAPTEGRSSLGFMMEAFMAEFDGRGLTDPSTPFDAAARDRWLASSDGIDVAGLRRAARVALERGEPLLVLATGFALVLLLDALGGEHVEAPERTVVMPTGGFKGRTREVDFAELVAATARAFRIPEGHVVAEYGMTELSSQLYEGTLPGGELVGPRGVYLPPPWLRVTPVDPETLRAVPDGRAGLLRFVDLGNVDSAVAIVTQDLGRRRGPGIELFGRARGAPARGCSLAVEEMVLGGAPP